LLEVGNGVARGESGMICIPEELIYRHPIDDEASTNVDDLIEHVYGSFDNQENRSLNSFSHKGIFALNNSEVNEINEKILEKFPGELHTFTSIDVSEDPLQYPAEYFNSIDPNNFPQHIINLKVGVPIMILRNINQCTGLVNGARLIITSIKNHCIKAKHLNNDEQAGREVILHRINLKSDDGRDGFGFTRRQLPIRLAFSMTINKSQGQTMSKVGIYLSKNVFSHGQLYVALSRCGDPNGVKIMILNGFKKKNEDGEGKEEGFYTLNIVYKEVLVH
jgi:ATP-dependent DNA helicase PIF1